MEIVLDVQCFRGFDNTLIIKEIAFASIHIFQHWIVKPPFAFYDLPKPLRKQACWLTHHYHGLEWESGFISQVELRELLHHLNATRVFVKGEEKRKLMFEYFDVRTEIINMDQLNCPSLKLISVPYLRCLYHSQHNNKYMCALTNTFHLYSWLYNEYKGDFEMSRESESKIYQNSLVRSLPS